MDSHRINGRRMAVVCGGADWTLALAERTLPRGPTIAPAEVGYVVTLARHPEITAQVAGAQEQHVDAVDRGDPSAAATARALHGRKLVGDPGWIIDEVVGPFKGGPGTWGW